MKECLNKPLYYCNSMSHTTWEHKIDHNPTSKKQTPTRSLEKRREIKGEEKKEKEKEHVLQPM